MVDDSPPDVGQRLRALREQRGLSLRALAESSGLSLNAISLIERGQTSPTVSTLHQLASALSVRVVDLFDSEGARNAVFVAASQRRQMRSPGTAVEVLATGLFRQRLEPLLVSLDPGASSGSEPIAHGGQEFIFVLSGCIKYRVAEETYALNEGDALLFEASLPHSWHNPTGDQARFLLILETAEGPGTQLLSHLERRQ